MKWDLTVLTLLALIAIAPRHADADPIYAINNTSSGISGIVSLDSNLDFQGGFFPGASPLSGIAVNGNDIYVSSGTSVYEYDTSGNLLHQFSGFSGNNISGLAFSGGDVYAIDNATQFGLSEVLTLDNSGDYTGAAFLTSASPLNGIAASENDIYVSSGTSVYEYDTSGNLLNQFSGFSGNNISGLTFSEGNVYAIDNATQFGLSEVLTLDDNGDYTGAAFLTSAFPLNGIAARGDDIYVSSGTSIYEYNTSGSLLNTFNVPNASNNFSALAAASPAPAPSVPEPSSLALFLPALAILLWRGRGPGQSQHSRS